MTNYAMKPRNNCLLNIYPHTHTHSSGKSPKISFLDTSAVLSVFNNIISVVFDLIFTELLLFRWCWHCQTTSSLYSQSSTTASQVFFTGRSRKPANCECFPISFVLCALAFKEDYFKNSNWFQFDFSLLFIVLTLVILENLRFSVCSMFLMILFHWPFSKTLSVSTFSLCSIISTIALQFVSTGPSQRPTNCECFHVFPVLYNFNNSLAIRFHLPFSKTSEH